jgi:protein TonB
MAVAIATVRPGPRLGPALRRMRVPVGGLVLSAALHGLLLLVVVFAGHIWRASQPKTYVVNLVPAIAASGSPRGRANVPEPTLPRVADLSPRPAPPPPSLPEREPARAAAPARATDLPERPPEPRESVSLPDRALPPRAPALPRPGEKELPRVASTTPPPPTTGPISRPAAPPPPAPLGRSTGSPQGVGALTLNAADFPFAWYLQAIHRKISEKWEGQARDGVQPQVVFEIERNGRIRALAVEKSSGNPLYDQAALRAISDATPFPELPKEFTDSFLRVHLGFSYSGTRG